MLFDENIQIIVKKCECFAIENEIDNESIKKFENQN